MPTNRASRWAAAFPGPPRPGREGSGRGATEAGAGPHATSATALMTVTAIRPNEMIIGKVLGE